LELREHQRAALLAWLMLSAVTTAPYVANALAPPRGARFVGAFFYRDDYYQYLSFAEQASRGHLVFRNKFDPRPHRPALVNLEWATAGILAASTGTGIVIGFHLVRLLAIGGLLWGAARLLHDAGLTGNHLRWALALVATGSGLGWLRVSMGRPAFLVPDVNMGLYPFHQALFNGHFASGTALLVGSLALHQAWRSAAKPRWPWMLSATALGLVRPFDLATFLLACGVLAALQAVRPADARSAWEQIASLAGLLPVLVYLGLLFVIHPSFRLWSGPQNAVRAPLPLDLAFALGPALGFAALGLRGQAPASKPCAWRLLVAWASAVALLLSVDIGFAPQVATSLGTLAVFAAAVLTPKRLLPVAVACLIPTSLFLLRLASEPRSSAFASEDYFRATRWLSARCRDGDVLLAPTDLSQMAAGLTPCSVVQGHRVLTPDFESRIAEADRFLDPATPTEWSRDYVLRTGARFVAAERLAAPALTAAGCALAVDLGRFALWVCAR